MTDDRRSVILAPNTLGRLSFVRELEPLPLVDPTTAARMLGLRRHSLACYRSLGDGPAFYKFGRWIRYAVADLRAFRGDWEDTSQARATVLDNGALVDPDVAACFLTVTRFCLSNYRREGLGPRYCRFGRRIHYPIRELHVWAEAQRHESKAPVENM